LDDVLDASKGGRSDEEHPQHRTTTTFSSIIIVPSSSSESRRRRRVSSSLLQVYAVCVRARKILHVKERKVFFSTGDSLEKKRGRFSFSLDYHKKKED
jgi:hypothetical protein